MPTGERASGRAPGLQRPAGAHLGRRSAAWRQRGFTYLAVLLVVALWSALAAGWALRSAQAAQREREHELLFRGAQIARAIGSYRAVDPAAPGPADLAVLLNDRRGAAPRHHLRQLYADPFTGRADWVLLTDAQRGLLGVRSRVGRPRLLQAAGPGAGGQLLSDWEFRAQLPAAPQPQLQ
jgi:type II secretory pathway pseudopilin PulG